MAQSRHISVPYIPGVLSTAWAYIRTMRLYYSFITGMAGWIGVAFARLDHPEIASPLRMGVVLLILFLAWGVNQVINDYLGLPEDRINAPHRPMVTGELHPGTALAISFALIAVSALVTLWLSPHALIFFFAAILLNVVYGYAKSIPLVGNVVFGVMIAFCTAYGYVATADVTVTDIAVLRPGVLIVVAVMNGLMTYYTYFKDIEGDRLAGKKTAVVALGTKAAGKLGYAMAYLPLFAIGLAYATGIMHATPSIMFFILLIFASQQQIHSGRSFLKGPSGTSAYRRLGDAIRACALGMSTLVALADPYTGLLLFVVTFVSVGILFRLHSDARA